MKKISLLALLIISLIACKKENIEKENPTNENINQDIDLVYTTNLKPIIFDYTSTGCPGCGSWGKPTFNNFSNEFDTLIVPIAIHIKYNDPMISIVSQTIAANRHGQLFTPQIWINDSNGVVISNNSIMVQESDNRIRNLIEISNANSLALIDGKVISKNDNISYLKLGVKAKNIDTSKEYFLSCYLMQNGIIHQQNGASSNPTTHDFVIRKTTEDTWGQKVEFEANTFEYKVIFNDEIINSDHHYVAVLWEKNQSRYIPLGGYKFE